MTLELLDLANEIIILIAENLGPGDLNSFLKGSQRLAWVLTPRLYEIAIQAPCVLPRYKCETVLHWAAAKGYESVVTGLLDSGADITVTTLRKKTALDYAAERGNIEIVKLLLEPTSLVKEVLDSQDRAGRTPLYTAALNGHESIVGLFLDHGANVAARTTKGKTVLHVAAENGHAGVVELLMGRGLGAEEATYVLDRRGRAPIHSAAVNGHHAVVKILMDFQVDTSIKTEGLRATALHLAAGRGHTVAVSHLLQGGADTNSLDHSGATPLHWVAENTYRAAYTHNRSLEPTAKLLLDRDANVNACNRSGETPLHHAALYREYTMRTMQSRRWRYEDRVPLKAQMRKKQAAEKAHRAVVELLLKWGANVNSRDDYRRTPLHYAANGEAYVVKRLLEMNAEIEAKDYEGKTALCLARELKRDAPSKDVIEAILEHTHDVPYFVYFWRKLQNCF